MKKHKDVRVALSPLDEKAPIGFGEKAQTAKKSTKSEQFETIPPDAHSIVLGPTGVGKTVGAVMPRLLEHKGPAFVIDVKGELYNTTAKQRRRLGQEVVVLDPFEVTSAKSFALNPLQMVVNAPDPANKAWQVVDALSPQDSLKEPFWDQSAKAFLVGLILHAVEREKNGNGTASLSWVFDLLRSDDVVYTLANLLDESKDMPDEAHRAISTVISLPDVTRGGVIVTAVTMLRLFGVEQIRRATDEGDIPLSSITNGDPMTLYIAVPPFTLKPYGPVLRLWMDTILTALFNRTEIPDEATLLAIDEAAALGRMNQLETAFAMGRGYGISVMAVFQTIHQISNLYDAAHRVLIDNAAATMAFPPANLLAAEEIAALFGSIPAQRILDLGPREVLLARHGRAPLIARRYDIRFHPRLRKLVSPNPRHRSSQGAV